MPEQIPNLKYAPTKLATAKSNHFLSRFWHGTPCDATVR